MRNLKVLGLSFVAVLAMTAVMASAAQASQFTAGAYPATIVGTQDNSATNKLTVGGGSVECETGNYSGTLAEASSTASVSLDYTGCETSFGTEAVIDNNGCGYTFHSGEEIESGSYAATADLTCPAGKELVVTLGLCNVRVAPQTGLTGVTLNNTATDIDVVADTTVSVDVKNVFLCPLKTGVQNGTLETTVTVEAAGSTATVD